MSSIERKNWHLIPIYPKLGSLIDEFGGRSVPLERKKDVDVSINTIVGMTEIHYGEDGLNVFAEDIGVDVQYEKNGILDYLELNVFDYCMSRNEETFLEMGGEDLNDLLINLLDWNTRMSVNFSLKKNEVSVIVSDESSENTFSEPIVIGKDLSQPNMFYANSGDFRIYFGCMVKEDEFLFGLLGKKIEDELTIDTEINMCCLLKDCNYITFLKSGTKDRYARLVKRIFLVKP